MKKRHEIIGLSTFWIIFILMELWFSYIIDNNQNPIVWQTLQTIGFVGLQLLIFFLNYLWICPKTIPQRKWTLFILGQFLLILLFPTLRTLIEEYLIFSLTGYHNYHPKSIWSTYYYVDNTYYSIRVLLFSAVFYFIKVSWNQQQQIKELELARKNAELQNLKNQMSPHFLFNTLNRFYSDLITDKPETAQDILTLSEMLRYVTYEQENDYVLLKDEIEFLNNYIELFNKRFDNQLYIQFDKKVENPYVKIPSLLLIHFVENALKHGISDDENRPIEIHLKTNHKQLNLHVKNHFKSQKNYDHSGIGYKNIQKRLNYLFPKNHKLEINKTHELYEIELEIPIHI